MQRLPTYLAAAIFTIPLLAQSAADEKAISAVVQGYMDARDHRDSKTLESLFTGDADQLVSSGEWRKGRAEVVRGTLASSRSSGGKRTITLASIRFVTPAVAIADGRYELSGMAGRENRSMWTSLLLVRNADGWRIAAIRNMLPAAPVPPK